MTLIAKIADDRIKTYIEDYDYKNLQDVGITAEIKSYFDRDHGQYEITLMLYVSVNNTHFATSGRVFDGDAYWTLEKLLKEMDALVKVIKENELVDET